MSSFCTTQKTLRLSVLRKALAQMKIYILFDWIQKEKVEWVKAGDRAAAVVEIWIGENQKPESHRHLNVNKEYRPLNSLKMNAPQPNLGE